MTRARTLLHRRLLLPGGPVDVLLVRNEPRSLAALRRARRGGDRGRARRRRRGADRRALLLGSALLRHALRLRGGRPAGLHQRPARRPLYRTVSGRPLSLSLSHSPRWVAVAVTGGKDRRVGVDVEDRGRVVAPRVAQRLPAGPAGTGTRGRGLLGRWCAVEAALKADGRGLSALERLRAAAGGRLRFTDRTDPPVIVRPIPALPPDCVGAVAVARRVRVAAQEPRR